jgi:hypothetical protein
VRVVKLTKQDNFLEKIGGYSNFERDLCFLIQHVKQFDTFLFNTAIDVVVTDISHHAIKILPNVSPDNILQLPKTTHNI